jgi:hypothetical protein
MKYSLIKVILFKILYLKMRCLYRVTPCGNWLSVSDADRDGSRLSYEFAGVACI